MNLLIYGLIGLGAYYFLRGREQRSASDGIPSPGVTTAPVPQRNQAGHNTSDEMNFTEEEAETAAAKAKGAKYLP